MELCAWPGISIPKNVLEGDNDNSGSPVGLCPPAWPVFSLADHQKTEMEPKGTRGWKNTSFLGSWIIFLGFPHSPSPFQ